MSSRIQLYRDGLIAGAGVMLGGALSENPGYSLYLGAGGILAIVVIRAVDRMISK